MQTKEEEFLKRIQATFRYEAEEHLRAFSSGLIELEKPGIKENRAEIIEIMFREIHSLKGAARSVDNRDVETLCQPLENVFSAMKRKEINFSSSFLGHFYKASDLLAKIITSEGIGQSPSERKNARELIQQLKELATGKSIEITSPELVRLVPNPEVTPPEAPIPVAVEIPVSHTESPATKESIRIRVSKLDPLLMQAEEMVQAKMAIIQRADELAQINSEITEWIHDSFKWKGNRFKASPEMWNEWMEDNGVRLNKLERKMDAIATLTRRDQFNLIRMVDNHLDAMKQIIMLPVSSLVEIFPVMVRKIAREQKKEIDFVITGTELEIDKRILEELKDPLIHLLRNCIDHGIGKPDERIRQNKPPQGKITLEFAARENGQVEIILSDDGRGIDTVMLMKAAAKAGISLDDSDGKPNRREVLNLIFMSGVSTSSIITDISGNGLGMSIVHEKVIKLNGRISVDTEDGKGTSFHILLPMTLATFRGVAVRVREFTYILPTMNVERVIMLREEDIRTIENHYTIRIDKQAISLADMGEVLGLPATIHPRDDSSDKGFESHNKICIVVLTNKERLMGFRVDEILEEQQVFVKGLGKLLRRVRNISGATILGSGKVVPVLNVSDLMKSALRVKSEGKVHSPEKHSAEKAGRILVVEDSITSRTMLKNVLEAAGYIVVTAFDGLDGFTKAREGEFDLIMSDVDMPRANGFEFIARIRADKKLKEVPAILLTALGSPEDRERGIDAGADAYIVKSSFDQGNLLDIIRKLI